MNTQNKIIQPSTVSKVIQTGAFNPQEAMCDPRKVLIIVVIEAHNLYPKKLCKKQGPGPTICVSRQRQEKSRFKRKKLTSFKSLSAKMLRIVSTCIRRLTYQRDRALSLSCNGQHKKQKRRLTLSILLNFKEKRLELCRAPMLRQRIKISKVSSQKISIQLEYPIHLMQKNLMKDKGYPTCSRIHSLARKGNLRDNFRVKKMTIL